MEISAKRRDRCLEQARKRVRFEQKWGCYFGAFQILLAILLWSVAGAFVYFVWACVRPMAANNAGQNQAVQDAITQGWTLGLLLGFLAGYIAFKGVFVLHGGIQTLRGDAASHMIVEYHDGLEMLSRDEAATNR